MSDQSKVVQAKKSKTKAQRAVPEEESDQGSTLQVATSSRTLAEQRAPTTDEGPISYDELERQLAERYQQAMDQLSRS